MRSSKGVQILVVVKVVSAGSKQFCGSVAKDGRGAEKTVELGFPIHDSLTG
jgi:hypothetical protein